MNSGLKNDVGIVIIRRELQIKDCEDCATVEINHGHDKVNLIGGSNHAIFVVARPIHPNDNIKNQNTITL